jgi:hypothetical protein
VTNQSLFRSLFLFSSSDEAKFFVPSRLHRFYFLFFIQV